MFMSPTNGNKSKAYFHGSPGFFCHDARLIKYKFQFIFFSFRRPRKILWEQLLRRGEKQLSRVDVGIFELSCGFWCNNFVAFASTATKRFSTQFPMPKWNQGWLTMKNPENFPIRHNTNVSHQKGSTQPLINHARDASISSRWGWIFDTDRGEDNLWNFSQDVHKCFARLSRQHSATAAHKFIRSVVLWT